MQQRDQSELNAHHAIALIGIGIARGGPGGLVTPPNEMLPMIKMSQKRLSFLQFQFLLASLRTTVQTYNSN